MKKAIKNKKGYTLVESAVASVILALMAIMAISSILSYSKVLNMSNGIRAKEEESFSMLENGGGTPNSGTLALGSYRLPITLREGGVVADGAAYHWAFD